MSEKQFKLSKYATPSSVSYFCDENGRMLNKEVVKVLNEQQSIIHRDEISTKTMMSNMKKLEEENEELKEIHQKGSKSCEKWKNLYELKDAEVTARVDALNKVCEYYTSEVLFKSDVDPNKAVKEVINEILNTPIYEE